MSKWFCPSLLIIALAVGLEKGLIAVEGIWVVSALGARSYIQESDSDSAFTLIKERGHQTKRENAALYYCKFPVPQSLKNAALYYSPSSSGNSTLILSSTTGVSSAVLSTSLVVSSLMTDSSIKSLSLSQATTLQSYTTASGSWTDCRTLSIYFTAFQSCFHAFPIEQRFADQSTAKEMKLKFDIQNNRKVFTTKSFEHEAFVTSISDSKVVPSFEKLRTKVLNQESCLYRIQAAQHNPLPLATNKDSQELWDCLRGLNPLDSGQEDTFNPLTHWQITWQCLTFDGFDSLKNNLLFRQEHLPPCYPPRERVFLEYLF
uniref:Uncharacterized protein n=1 Tax=Tanacetum cinerariifolium TaxID=118510 RepID=A0A6L2KTG3_TANCI|nr:hypothetical protein [Tanacetum cinerariifolium]